MMVAMTGRVRTAHHPPRTAEAEAGWRPGIV